jgi:hypothetical protein
MKRIIVALSGIAALVAALYPAVSEAFALGGKTFNHNETLVRDR